MSSSRIIILSACVLLLAHAGILASVGTSDLGAFVSDLVQFVLGLLVLFTCLLAAHRSEDFGRYCWRLAGFAFALWAVAQGLSTYGDVCRVSALTYWSINILFCFWFVPLAMALFLDPDRQLSRFDWPLVLDFIQAVLFCFATYLYFFYLPRSESATDLAHSVWQPYLVGHGVVAGAFLLRSVLTPSATVRVLFRRVGLFLSLSAVIDAYYYYGPGRELRTGSWFDILWSALLMVPLVTAAEWKQLEMVEPAATKSTHVGRSVVTQLFPLLFPFLTLVMSIGIAQQRLTLAAVVVLVAFGCSSARLLVTQHQLLQTQEALRHEAAHDGLTGLLNRRAILEIMQRELKRAERTGNAVGVVLVDVDHFKSVNDAHGHAVGDLVLRIMASEIAAALRPYDAIGRYGGEEFLIVAPGCGMKETWSLAERVRTAVANCSISIGTDRLRATLSLGVASGDARSSESLLQVADQGLYEAKRTGRNRVKSSLDDVGTIEGDSSLPEVTRNFWL